MQGMATYGEMLYPLLEGPVYTGAAGGFENVDGRQYLRIFAFNATSKTFVTGANGDWPRKYLLENNANAIGDFNCINERYCMIIERDNGEGEP